MSELIKPADKQTRDKESSAPGGRLSLLTFFGEAKKVSGARCRSAQRHQEEFRGWESARRLWRFLFFSFKHLWVPSLKPFIHAGFGTSPRQWENWKNAWAEAQAYLQKEVT